MNRHRPSGRSPRPNATSEPLHDRGQDGQRHQQSRCGPPRTPHSTSAERPYETAPTTAAPGRPVSRASARYNMTDARIGPPRQQHLLRDRRAPERDATRVAPIAPSAGLAASVPPSAGRPDTRRPARRRTLSTSPGTWPARHRATVPARASCANATAATTAPRNDATTTGCDADERGGPITEPPANGRLLVLLVDLALLVEDLSGGGEPSWQPHSRRTP